MSDEEILSKALRNLPAPKPRPGFVDAALANATRVSRGSPDIALPRHALMRRQTWLAAAAGAVFAAALMWFLLQPLAPDVVRSSAVALTMNESRNVDVLIESDRELHNATIRITLTGGVALDGFDDQRQIDWQADVERGANVISLPIVARHAGAGRLVAIVEHGGKTRTVIIDLTVNDIRSSRT